MRTCEVPGCDREYVACGFCDKHYYRSRKYGDPLGGPIPEWRPQGVARSDNLCEPNLTYGQMANMASLMRVISRRKDF